jgi:hypothetical protein
VKHWRVQIWKKSGRRSGSNWNVGSGSGSASVKRRILKVMRILNTCQNATRCCTYSEKGVVKCLHLIHLTLVYSGVICAHWKFPAGQTSVFHPRGPIATFQQPHSLPTPSFTFFAACIYGAVHMYILIKGFSNILFAQLKALYYIKVDHGWVRYKVFKALISTKFFTLFRRLSNLYIFAHRREICALKLKYSPKWLLKA